MKMIGVTLLLVLQLSSQVLANGESFCRKNTHQAAKDNDTRLLSACFATHPHLDLNELKSNSTLFKGIELGKNSAETINKIIGALEISYLMLNQACHHPVTTFVFNLFPKAWKLVCGADHGHYVYLSMLFPMVSKVGEYLDVFDYGMSPLHVAALFDSKEALSFLLENGADVDKKAKKNIFHGAGPTPLHIAAGAGHGIIVHSLLENRAALNVLDHHGTTPLMLAVMGNSTDHQSVLKVLLEQGANCDISDKQGQYPINHAVMVEDIISVQYLMKYNCLNGLDGALLAASALQNLELMQMLLDAGANVDVGKDSKDKLTPLHFAAVTGDLDVAHLLIQRGATLDFEGNCLGIDKNRFDCSPAMLASMHKHHKIATVLYAYQHRLELVAGQGALSRSSQQTIAPSQNSEL